MEMLGVCIRGATHRNSSCCVLCSDTNTQNLHEEHPEHPLHNLTKQNRSQRYMKQRTFNNNNSSTTNRDSNNPQITSDDINQNMEQIHTEIVQNYLQNREHNKIIHQQAPVIDKSEEKLSRLIRRTLAQLRTGKSPFLQTYLNKINPKEHTSPLCPLCKQQEHTTNHLFTCNHIQTTLTPLNLWLKPAEVVSLLEQWQLATWPSGSQSSDPCLLKQ